MNNKLWNIFCKVIDNYGDIGVCWRLAVGLAHRGERVRLWLDDASALTWMAPQGVGNVEVMIWSSPFQMEGVEEIGDILIEAFGCEIASEFVKTYAHSIAVRKKKALWINLEYLTAEGFAERCHTLPSPVMSGPGKGLTKHFFYPGFTVGTGGLLKETDLLKHQNTFNRTHWLNVLGISAHGEQLISLFCYEPPALCELLEHLATHPIPTRLLVTSGRATAAVKACIAIKSQSQPAWNQHQRLQFSFLPPLTQLEYDSLLWACDLNFVRGEDSLVRAIWSGKPFVWQIYPQEDGAHFAKLEAFLNILMPTASLRQIYTAWNTEMAPDPVTWSGLDLAQWEQTVKAARAKLLRNNDLVTQLLGFALKNH